MVSPRQPREYRATHRAADKLEPPLARAFQQSVQTIQKSVSINALAMAIASGDVKAAMRLLPVKTVRESLEPVAEIVRDAVMKGGELGADAVREAVK